MECQQLNQYLDDDLDGTLSEPHRQALQQHVRKCALCQARYDEQTALHGALKAWRVPPARAGFADRVLKAAGDHHRWRPATAQMIGMAMAASLVIGIGMGLMLAPMDTGQTDSVQTVAMTIGQARTVSLAFESAQELRDVTLTLSLPEDVELVGYPGQRTLSWQTNLKAGKNQLSLPLIARKGAGGTLAAALNHGKQHKEFSLYLAVQHQRDAARNTDTYAVSI